MSVVSRLKSGGYAAALAALSCAGTVHAQEAEQAEDSTIIVTGEVSREVDEGEVRSQTRAITPRGSIIGQPLARFQQPVCPGVWGLSGESAQLIIDRIYYNAEAAGLALNEDAGCAANVIVAFVPDPHAEFQSLRDARNPLVEGLSYWERKRVAETDGPVLAWNVVSTRTAAGQARTGRPPVYDGTEMSRLSSATRRDIESAVVLIDVDAMLALDGIAVADYATMRLLARTRPPRNDEPVYGTILSLFDNPADAPERMTDFDRAYLASLYAGRANTPGGMALRNVGDLMEQGVEGAD